MTTRTLRENYDTLFVIGWGGVDLQDDDIQCCHPNAAFPTLDGAKAFADKMDPEHGPWVTNPTTVQWTARLFYGGAIVITEVDFAPTEYVEL